MSPSSTVDPFPHIVAPPPARVVCVLSQDAVELTWPGLVYAGCRAQLHMAIAQELDSVEKGQEETALGNAFLRADKVFTEKATFMGTSSSRARIHRCPGGRATP